MIESGTNPSSQSPGKRLREIFELLIRTMKTLSLYEARNPVSEKLETELYSRLAQLLDDEGPIELKVQQHRILFEEETVYENPENKESLAFLFSRDGIRGFVFKPGLEIDELRAFVSCLNSARALVGGEDDLATLMWDQDFGSIDYFVIDELSDDAVEPGAELLGSGWSASSEMGQPEGGGAVALQDLRPSARMPIKNAQLSDEEIEALHGELAEESTADLPRMAVELAVELVMLEPDEDERRIIGTALAGILDELLVRNKPDDFLRSFGHLSELAGEGFAVERTVTDLFELVRHAVARDGQLRRFFAAAEGRLERTDQVNNFLARLPEAALPILMARLGRVQQSALRRAVADAILVHGDRGPRQLMEQLPALRAAGDTMVIDELLHMVRHLPQESACPLIEKLLDSNDAELARRGAMILGHLRGESVEQLLLGLLEKGEPGIRSMAVAALARCGNRERAPQMLKMVLDPDLRFDSEETQRVLAAVGRLGGDPILATFDRLLQEKSDVWFPTREEKDLVRALVHGVRSVGSAASKAYLEKMAGSGNRILKGVSREALGGGRS